MLKDPYKKIAGLYDRSVEPFNTGIRNIAFKMSGAKAGMNVLEAGCGTGTNLELYLKHGCNIHGIDLSLSMLNIAEKKIGKNAGLLLGDASNMAYNNESFDLVIAMLTLHEMPESIREKVLREMYRVMKKNGRILLIDYHPGPIFFPMGWIYKAIILFFEIAAGREHYKNYRNFIKKGCLLPLISSLNLIIDKKKIISKGNFALFLLKANQ